MEIRIMDYKKNNGSNNYREKVHRLIPGGAHTYSKGDDQFPANAPAAIVRGYGAYVWDIDGNKFLDCSMGLTSVSLGHAYPSVVERVKEELYNGVNFQRPSHLELQVAKEFLGIVDYHDMVKFAKNGSTVTTAAVKLARGFTGRKLVAFPYDHPFYSYDDWFIGKTACDFGVPEEITNLSVTFKSCDIESLKSLFERYPGQIAAVIMEPEKNFCGDCDCLLKPKAFLEKVIDLCHENGTLFIADEMITGFKTHLPGSCSKYGVVPDLATWGKGIGNGFSFCALTGKREIMELGGIQNEGQKKLFLISTTHGGETTALAAVLSVIKEFKERDVVSHINKIGSEIIKLSKDLIKKAGLEGYIQLSPSPWQVAFVFRDANKDNSAGYRTLFLQEMINNKVLFQGIFQPCYSHNKIEVEIFCEAFSTSLKVYSIAMQEGLEKYLRSEIIKPVFRKYI